MVIPTSDERATLRGVAFSCSISDMATESQEILNILAGTVGLEAQGAYQALLSQFPDGLAAGVSGGGPFIVLEEDDPVPEGTEAGTLILRRVEG